MRDAADAQVRVSLGHPPAVFATPSSVDLARRVLAHLEWQAGACKFSLFANGEISVKLEQPVTNCDVFVVCSRNDQAAEMNFTIMQTLLLIDALRGESPHRITVVLPCLEYARQDRRLLAGEAIPPKLLLRCMRTAGATRFITVDLHNQAEAAFSPPGAVLDELSSDKYLADFIRSNVPNFQEDRVLVCATSGGGLKFTRRLADELCTGFVMADRTRSEAGRDEYGIMADPEDAENVDAFVVVDDMFDTCGSLAEVCKALHDFAPQVKIYAVAPHGYLSGQAHVKIKELVDSCGLQWIAITNTVAPSGALGRFHTLDIADKLRVIDISKLVAGAIVRIHIGASVNIPAFRRLGPASHDSLLQEAPAIPSRPYVYISQKGDAPGAKPEVQLKRRPTLWE